MKQRRFVIDEMTGGSIACDCLLALVSRSDVRQAKRNSESAEVWIVKSVDAFFVTKTVTVIELVIFHARVPESEVGSTNNNGDACAGIETSLGSWTMHWRVSTASRASMPSTETTSGTNCWPIRPLHSVPVPH